MKKIILLLFLSSLVFAQDEQLGFEFDFAQFGYDSTSNFVEFYYSFNQQQLESVESEGEQFVSAVLSITIQGVNVDTALISREWTVNNNVTEKDIKSSSLVGVLGFKVPEGDYLLTVKGTDANKTSVFKQIEDELKVTPRIMEESYSISDLELATNIKNENVNKSSIFYKNTLEVIPNPVSVFSNASPVVFYYCELYNLDKGDQNPLLLTRHLFNSRGKLLENESKGVDRNHESIVEVDLINMKKYPTDSYNLVITLYDSTTNKGVTSSKRFYMLNPGVKDTLSNLSTVADYLGSEFGVSSEEELDDLFEKSKYIATGDEIDQYEDIDSVSAKREFIFKFWQKRDPQPSTEENEFKTEYMYRLGYVAERYGSIYKDGYKTDRGRVYLMYGEPDQIDRYPNETDMKPYEIWYYNSMEGGVYFVFGDISGFSDYEMLSSTKRGEYRDDNWTRRISTSN